MSLKGPFYVLSVYTIYLAILKKTLSRIYLIPLYFSTTGAKGAARTAITKRKWACDAAQFEFPLAK